MCASSTRCDEKEMLKHVDPEHLGADDDASSAKPSDAAVNQMFAFPTKHSTTSTTTTTDTADNNNRAETSPDLSNDTFAMIDFIIAMGAAGSLTGYTPTQTLQMLNKCEAMLADLPAKVSENNEWVTDSAIAGKSATETIDEAIAAFIYSVDAKDCDCRTVQQCLQRQLDDSISGRAKHRTSPGQPKNTQALGSNGAHWAMMNWVRRLLSDESGMLQLDAEAQQTVRAADQFFAPLRCRLNSGLKVFPREPRVVFRGITVAVANKYALGSNVRFGPFTSTSLEGEEALKFMRKGGTYFVINTHSGAMIADFSHYPEQAESLLRTNCEFIVTSKMSGTLQQMLGNDFDVVFMSEKDSPLDEKQTIKQLVDGMRTTQFVYIDYQRTYVEGRVSQVPPPLISTSTANSPSVKPFPLYKATEHFVNGLTIPYMLLLGSGGAGKTSALIGSLCQLMKLKSRHTRPLLPTFVSLPSVGAALHEAGGLDRHLQAQLRLSDSAFELLLSEARVVLLLDSLDEVVPHPQTNASILATKLLEQNPWSARTKVIISCRTEFLDNQHAATGANDGASSSSPADHAFYESSVHSNAATTLVYHVWPFDQQDREAFMRQAASGRIEELARREANDQYERLHDRFQLSDDQLSHPCVLRIATNVVASSRANGGGPDDALQNLYTLYDAFVRSPFIDEGFEATDIDEIAAALRDLAIRMAKTKVWHVRVGDVRKRLAAITLANKKCNDLLKVVPSRCEDIYNDEALWGFWHKTVGEFLAAQAIAADPKREVDVSHGDDLARHHPVIADMLSLSKMDTFNFSPNPQNLRATALSISSLDNVRVVSLSNVVIAGENVDVNSWVDENLRNFAPKTPTLTLTLPIFSELKALPSLNILEEYLGELHLNIAASFPAVEEIDEGFQVRSVKGLRLPFCPRLKAVPANFLQEANSITHITSDSDAFCAAELVGAEFLALKGESAVETLQLPSFQRVTRIAEGFLRNSSAKSISFPADAMSAVNVIGDDFMSPCNIEGTMSIPSFPSVVSIGHNFCARFQKDAPPLKKIIFNQDVNTDDSTFAKLDAVGECFMSGALPNSGGDGAAGEGVPEVPAVGNTSSAELEISVPHFDSLTQAGPCFMASSGLSKFNFEQQTKDDPAKNSRPFFPQLEVQPTRFMEGTAVFNIPQRWERSHLIPREQASEVPTTVLASLEANPDVNMFSLESTNPENLLPDAWHKATEASGSVNWVAFRPTRPVRLILPIFNNDVAHEFNFEMWVSNLDMADSLPAVQTLGNITITGADTLTLPLLPIATRHDGNVTLNHVKHVRAHPDALPTMETTINISSSSLETIQFPRFSGVKQLKLDLTSCSNAPLKEITFPQDGLENVVGRLEGPAFLLGMESMLESLRLPTFKSLTSIGDGFLKDFKSLKVLEIPGDAFENVTDLGDDFMSGCSNMQQLALPGFPSVVSVGSSLLKNCIELKDVAIPKNAFANTIRIGSGFLSGCSSLERLTLPAFPSLEKLDDSFVDGCKGLKVLDIPKNAFNRTTEIGSRFVCECPDIAHIELPTFSALQKLGGSFLDGCSGLTAIVLPHADSSNGDAAFVHLVEMGDGFLKDCSSLERIQLPLFPNLEKLGSMFKWCTGLREVIFPAEVFAKVTTVGDAFLCGCTSMERLDIPRFPSLGRLSDSFLKGCTGLKQVTIPKDALASVSEIGNKFMMDCSAIERVALPAFPNLSSVGVSFMRRCSALLQLEFPQNGSCAKLTKVGMLFLDRSLNVDKAALPGCIPEVIKIAEQRWHR